MSNLSTEVFGLNAEVIERGYLGGQQYIFKFDNGYGASVVRNRASYGHEDGLWELAVLDSNGDLCYSTEITDNVLGYLDEDDVTTLLGRIKNL